MEFTFSDLASFAVKNTRAKSSNWDAFLAEIGSQPVFIPASAGVYMTSPKKEGAVPQERTKAARDESSLLNTMKGRKDAVLFGGKSEGVQKRLYIPVDDESEEFIHEQWAKRKDAETENPLILPNPETGVQSYVCFAVVQS